MNMPPRYLADFQHYHAAHCESGVTSSLLANAGIALSEPMCFGIGGGLFFIYAPFFKVMGLPLLSFRSMPGSIFCNTAKRLGVRYTRQRFFSKEKGVRQLNALLDQNIPVGLQTNIFWLHYVPKRFRFHFNAHNIIAFGREGGQHYKVSDPCLETTMLCHTDALAKARFSRGPLSPRGLIYYPHETSGLSGDLSLAVSSGIKQTCRAMLDTKMMFLGVNGIRFLGTRLPRWPESLKNEDLLFQYLANVVRMQEEIGTGGAGFRYLYAGFLQESAQLTGIDGLARGSERMESVADLWRQFGVLAAKTCKSRATGTLAVLGQMLVDLSWREREVFVFLREQCR